MIVESVIQPVIQPVTEPGNPSNPYHLLTLSAKSSEALSALAQAYVERLDQLEPWAFGDLCWSAWALRSHFSFRLAIVARTASEAKAQLFAYLANPQNQRSFDPQTQVHPAEDDRLAMLSHLAQQYRQGVNISNITWPDITGNRVDLPTYPFQRETYWIDVPARQKTIASKNYRLKNHLFGNCGLKAAVIHC